MIPGACAAGTLRRQAVPSMRGTTAAVKSCLSVIVVCLLAGRLPAGVPLMKVDVDASDLPRRLLHARIEMPARSGGFAFWYPKWIPGVHAPGGPIQNMGGLRLTTPDGKTLSWRRHDEALHRFECTVPKGADRVIAKLDYICNQPSVNSVGVDSYGNSLVGVINFNTCLIYPDKVDNDKINVRLRVRLPEGWRFATSLVVDKAEDGWTAFKTVTLREVVDSPLIAGTHFRSIPLTVDGFPPVFLDLTSESPGAIQIEDDHIEKFKKLVEQAKRLFGVGHFPRYHLLVVLSDQIRNMGLEHLRSSLNGVGERDFIDEKKQKGWAAYLLPHEFVHSWCGKYRRPAGMFTRNYHDPKHTKLLWIYEGLTQYLGEVLTVRAGFLTPEEYLDRLAGKISYQMQRKKGREWRSLEDTAVDAWHLRGGSPNWVHLRRSQDYYNEGLLLWMEADAIIRHASDGRRSLDDFCKQFLGENPSKDTVVPYELDEVLQVLGKLARHNWREFFTQRITAPLEHLPLDVVTQCGYRIEYTSTPTDYLKEQQDEHKFVAAEESLGLGIGSDGGLGNVVPGRIGDRAGLAPGMKILGVNGRKFTQQRMKDALADSPVRRNVELLVLDGDEYRTIKLDYAGGPRYLRLVRDKNRPDVLGRILKPREGK